MKHDLKSVIEYIKTLPQEEKDNIFSKFEKPYLTKEEIDEDTCFDKMYDELNK